MVPNDPTAIKGLIDGGVTFSALCWSFGIPKDTQANSEDILLAETSLLKSGIM